LVIWLVPGGGINPGITVAPGHNLIGNYSISSDVLPPSMAICYSEFDIANAAVHLTRKGGANDGWNSVGVTLQIHAFCEVDSGGKPTGTTVALGVGGHTNCQCPELTTVIKKVGCKNSKFLAVSFTSDIPLGQTAPPYGISVTLGVAGKLQMPS